MESVYGCRGGTGPTVDTPVLVPEPLITALSTYYPGLGGDSCPFWMGCVNTILKEMGPFSASSEWHEWINFHAKWVSY